MENKKIGKKIKKDVSSGPGKIKFQAFGNSVEEAFGNSLIAIFRSMYEGDVKRKYSHKVKIKGNDVEDLLYNFLKEFIFLSGSKDVFVSKVDAMEIGLDKKELECVISGDLAKNYKIDTKVKSIDHKDMFIKEEKGVWVIQVSLNI